MDTVFFECAATPTTKNRRRPRSPKGPRPKAYQGRTNSLPAFAPPLHQDWEQLATKAARRELSVLARRINAIGGNCTPSLSLGSGLEGVAVFLGSW